MTFKEIRQASGMNTTDFAKYFNIPYRTVQKWELEERECKPYIIDLLKYKLEKEGFFASMKKLKPIEGYESLYSISTDGKIYSHKNEKYLSCGSNGIRKDSYIYVRLVKDGKSKQVSVHRLVAKTFIPNPKNLPIVHHIDGNRKNNCVENLEWCTQKENVAHCIESGNFGTMTRKIKIKQEKGIQD